MAEARGVVVPQTGGTRSTSALARQVVAAALGAADPVGSAAATRETDWRRRYPEHFRRALEAGLSAAPDAVDIARRGLAALHESMRFAHEGRDIPITEAFDLTSDGELTTTEIPGSAEPEAELSLPFRGTRLRGDALHQQLDTWVRRGAMEPSAADAVREVMANPQWLALPGRTTVVLGAGAEMGPLRALLRWGATVAALDLPRPALWREIIDIARSSAGRVLVPVGSEGLIEERAGADLLHNLPAVARWVAALPGSLVLGNYVYADGADNLRVSTAVDALTQWVLDQRDDVALAFLATPTDVFGVPAEAVDFSTKAYDSARLRVIRPAIRVVSGGRLLRRNYAPGSDPGINDSVVAQQGPNYLLAKRLQRWRATVAAVDGREVSMNVAPPTRTRSVLKNRALAAAYAGAHRFGVDVFAPATSNTLMAALLVHDLCSGVPQPDEPWRREAHHAVHGGLWRTAYEPRSALGIAVVLGIGRNRA